MRKPCQLGELERVWTSKEGLVMGAGLPLPMVGQVTGVWRTLWLCPASWAPASLNLWLLTLDSLGGVEGGGSEMGTHFPSSSPSPRSKVAGPRLFQPLVHVLAHGR